MKKNHSETLRLALPQVAFLMMISTPMLVFPSGSAFPRYLADWMAFMCLGVWGLITVSQPEIRRMKVEINSLGLLGICWMIIISVQWASGLIMTDGHFMLISLGYLLAMITVGVLVKWWIMAGFENVMTKLFLFGILLVSVGNAMMMWIQSWPTLLDFFQPWIAGGDFSRPSGFISQPNLAATWCVIGILALVFLVDEKATSLSAKPSAWRIAVLVFLLCAVNLSLSRIATLELILLAVLLWGYRRTYGIHPFWFLLPIWQWALTFIQFDIANHPLIMRFDGSNQERWGIYAGALELIKAHPWLGIGWRQFQLFQASMPEFSGVLDHAHNLWIQIQLELGFLGSLTLLVFLLHWLRQLGKLNGSRIAVFVGMTTALLLGLHSMTEYPLWFAPSLFAFSIGVAFLPEPKTWLSFPVNAFLKILFFLTALLTFLSIDTDHKAGFDRFVRYLVHPTEAVFSSEKSRWFAIYDDYIELDQLNLNSHNIDLHNHQILDLTNYFTVDMPLHALLKMYVHQHRWDQAYGLAQRICTIDPAKWRIIVARNLGTSSDEMHVWFQKLPLGLLQCDSNPEKGP
jgi:O-antigen ligase